MADPFEHRYGRGNDPGPPIHFTRGLGIYSQYYFHGSHHYVLYDNGMADHFYTSQQITDKSLGFLKWGFRLGIVAYPILFLMVAGLVALIVRATGVVLLVIPFVLILRVMGGACFALLWYLRSRYKKDSRAFYLPYADKVYQQTACPNCGGISVYGVHYECPHCGKIMPPAAGPIYLN